MQDSPQDIKVVQGDGSELEISPVYDHINNMQQPRKKKKQDIVIPKIKKKEQQKEK